MFGPTKKRVEEMIASAIPGMVSRICEAVLKVIGDVVDGVEKKIELLRSDFAKEVAALSEHAAKTEAIRCSVTMLHLAALYEFCGIEIDKPHSLQYAKVRGLLPAQLKDRLHQMMVGFNALTSETAGIKQSVHVLRNDLLAKMEAEIKALRESNERLAQRVGFLHARMNRQLGDNPDCELNLAEVALMGAGLADRTDMLAAVAGGEFEEAADGSGEFLRIGYRPKKPAAPKKKERKRK